MAKHNPSAAQKRVQVAFSKARKEGLGGKALGRRIKQILGKTGKAVKRRTTKIKKSKSKQTRTVKSKSTSKKSVVAKKGGTKGMTRVKKLLIGLGVGTTFSTIAALTRVREIEGVAPIIDAAVGGGVEAQIGTAIPRLIRIVAGRAGFNGGNGNGLSLEGA